MLNNWPYCDIHHEMLSKVPIVDKVRGHVSQYEGEDEPADEGWDGT